MSWRSFFNIFNGQSVAIAPGCDLAEVPSEFVDLVTDQYRQAHGEPGAYFEELANRCETDGLVHFYRAVASSGGGVLEVHTSEPVPGHAQTDVLFRVRTRRLSLGFRLPRVGCSCVAHPMLRELYAAIDGTVEGEIWESGGIVPADRVGEYVGDREFKDSGGFVGPDNDIDTFYRSDAGDALFACKEKAVWFRHEDCSFVEAGPLKEVLDRYFTSLLDGTVWLPDPYS